MEDQLEFAMELARSLGASYAEARFQSDYSESSLLKNGSPEVTGFESKKGISVRVLVNGGLGFGSTNRLNRRDLRTLVKRAISSARAASAMRKSPIEFASEEATQSKVDVRSRVSFDSVDIESRIELLKEIDGRAVDEAERLKVSLPGRYVTLETMLTEKMVMTSEGTRVSSRIPRVSLDLFLTTAEPSRGTVQRSINLGEASGWEGIERWDAPKKVAEEVCSLASVLTKAEAVKEEVCDLVLGPEVVGIVSHESSGHPAEADRILGREAAQAGETYLEQGSIGLRVGSEAVNVVDDPTLPHSYGFYLFDDEGVRARKRYLIKEGLISGFLHNRETARTMGVFSNGASRSNGYDREPIVRMSNTFVEPGDLSFDELVEGVRFGVYLKSFMEWNIDDRRFNQRYVGLEAYRIEDGQLRGRIRSPVLELTTPALWSAVDAVGKDLHFDAANCGKGDPMQGIPVWTGGPHMRLRNVRLGGSA